MAVTHTYDTPASHTTRRSFGALDWIAMVLLIVGGLNWGLVGLFDYNLVARLFGDGSAITRIIYIAVGLSALYSLYMAARMSRREHH